MDIKNRLNITNILKPDVSRSFASKDLPENIDSVSFDENETVLGILTEKINSGNNIIYICPQNCNKKTVALLLKNYVRRNKQVIFPNSNIEYVQGAVNFISDVSGNEFSEVLKSSILGMSSFVVGLNLNSYENILEKVETIIALNSGMTEKYIKILLREFAPFFVYIEEENGVYTVKSIDKPVINGSVLEVKNLYIYLSGNNQNQTSYNNSEKSVLPDFKSVLEDTVSKENESVVSELILNNPALKTKTDKYVPVEIEKEKSVEKNSGIEIKTEEISVNEILQKEEKFEAEQIIDNNEDIQDNEQGIIPSIKNILEDDYSETEKEILSDVKSDDVLITEQDDKPAETEEIIEAEEVKEQPEEETIDLSVPAQATPVNKYKALRDKIKNKKEKELESTVEAEL